MKLNDNVGKCGHAKCAGGTGEHCFWVGKGMRTFEDIKAEGEALARLDYLREEIKAERISYSEIAELQSLAAHIPKGDTLLMEWAGICEHCGSMDCKNHDCIPL